MPLARFTVGSHDPSCTGCPCCDEGAASLLTMPDATYAAVLTAATAAVSAGQPAVLRAARVLRTTRGACGGSTCTCKPTTTTTTTTKGTTMQRTDSVPTPPDLRAAIMAHRSGEPVKPKAKALRTPDDRVPPPPNVAEYIVATRTGGAVTENRAATRTNGVPPPPDLRQAIMAARAGGAA